MIAPADITNTRIETERLILRPWRETDLHDFYEYAKVDGVGQMAGWKPHGSMEESREILERFLTGKRTYALVLKENGKVIGSLGLEAKEYPFIDAALSGREFGYALSRDYWGRGLMPEAVQAAMAHCFDVLCWDYILCGHFVWNQQSRRVVEKSGFQYLREVPYQTRMGTVETARLYIRYNPNKTR